MFPFWLKSDNSSVEISSYLFYEAVLNTSYKIKKDCTTDRCECWFFVDVRLQFLLILTLDGFEWLPSLSRPFYPQFPLSRKMDGPQISMEALEEK